MLYRTLNQTRICITQPTHAWVSGQLAQRWGNSEFGAIAPYAAVCLGAEQHDIGWIPWEAAPTFNPQTGYPHSFTEVGSEVHTRLWSKAKHLALPMGRYVALLVSLHGTGLYERFTHWKRSPESTRIVEAFLNQEREFQQLLLQQLAQDSAYAPYVEPDVIARNQRLVATMDALSLALCMAPTTPQQLEHVPTTSGETTLTLVPNPDDPTQWWLEPWCFQTKQVTVVFEGRVLQQQASSEQFMREQLADADWVTLTATLQVAGE